MEKYKNRQEAGQILAHELRALANRDDVIVLALPRGGVPVAYEIAKALHVPLDVFIVRKLGVPGHPELAMGALAMGGVTIFNESIIRDLHIPEEAIQHVIAQEKLELLRRETVYRDDRPFPDLRNKTVILVDDGVATGASIRAAITAIRQFSPAQLIVAVPVVAQQTCLELELSVDKLVCPLRPANFYAVGAWYEDFTQTEDAEVYSLLQQAQDYALNDKDE